jgi:hypothetical protein
MSVHIADPRRPRFASPDRLLATDAEVRAAFDGYFGYFGTYSVDEKAGTMTHHVEGAAFPNYAGTDQTRQLTIDGDRLELATPPIARRRRERHVPRGLAARPRLTPTGC